MVNSRKQSEESRHADKLPEIALRCCLLRVVDFGDCVEISPAYSLPSPTRYPPERGWR